MEKEMKLNPKLQMWLATNVVEDLEDNFAVAGTAIAEVRKKWNMGFENEPTILGFYSIVYQAILNALKEKRSSNSRFGINIANIVEFGFDDATDDGESEKQGNFCPYIWDIEDGNVTTTENPDLTTIERCTEWVSANIKEQKKILGEIATNALKDLADVLDIHLSNSVAVFPAFCTIHETLVQWMKLHLADTGESEVMINFANNFDIYARLTEDGSAYIEYSPKPSQKLDIKSDASATAVNE